MGKKIRPEINFKNQNEYIAYILFMTILIFFLQYFVHLIALDFLKTNINMFFFFLDTMGISRNK